MTVLKVIKNFKIKFSLQLSIVFSALTVIVFLYKLTDVLNLSSINTSMLAALTLKALQVGFIVFIVSYILFRVIIENSLSNKVWYQVKERNYAIEKLDPNELKRYDAYRNRK